MSVFTLPLLADAIQPISFTQLGLFVATAIAISGFIVNVAMLANMRKTQKREVLIEHECASKHELEKLESKVNDEDSNLHSRITKAEDRAEDILKETRDLISEVPNNVIDILRKTGVIK